MSIADKQAIMAEEQTPVAMSAQLWLAHLQCQYLGLLAQQLPPLAKFTGQELDDGDTVQEWLAQFE